MVLGDFSQKQAECALLDFQKRSNTEQRALCCLLGAISGDNLGNYNEFSYEIDDISATQAMTMPGGGYHSLLPGQSTDDTELALSMGYALLEERKKEERITRIDCNAIAKYYQLWIRSSPFDVGMTIGAAINVSKREEIVISTTVSQCRENLLLAQTMRWSVIKQNSYSQSNGGCMRITPLCLFLSNQTDQSVIRRIVFAEQSLTHCHPIALEASYVYVRMCIKLIQGISATELVEDLESYFKSKESEINVRGWWKDVVSNLTFDNAVQSMGWVKHGLTQCFIVLKKIAINEQQKSQDIIKKSALYQIHIKDVLSLCGDSDTNCAIVGGMIGAYLTLEDFPTDYLNKIISCDLQTSQSGLIHPRPSMLNPRNAFEIAANIIDCAPLPSDLIVIIDEVYDQEAQKKVSSRNEQKAKELTERFLKIYQEEETLVEQKPKKKIQFKPKQNNRNFENNLDEDEDQDEVADTF